MNQTTLTKAIPVFIAVMVWLIRVLIIGAISFAGENLFSLAESRTQMQQTVRAIKEPTCASNPGYIRPIPKPISAASNQRVERVEPTYHPIGLNAQPRDERKADLRQ